MTERVGEAKQAEPEAERVANDWARRLASAQIAAANRYGEVLRPFADGAIGGGELGKKLLAFAYQEGVRGVGEAFKAGVDYYAWLLGLVGVKSGDDGKKPGAEPVRAAGR